MKNKIIIITTLSLIAIGLLTLILFNEIPRLSFRYDETLDGYFITHCYGNGSTYEIPETYKNKKIVGMDREVFRDNKSLETLDLSMTEIVEIPLATFSNCSNLESIILPSSLTYIANNAFYRCESLENINLAETNLTILAGSVFYGCTSLNEVYLPDTLTEIGSYCFYNTNIESLSLSSNTRLLDNALTGVNIENIIYREVN